MITRSASAVNLFRKTTPFMLDVVQIVFLALKNEDVIIVSLVSNLLHQNFFHAPGRTVEEAGAVGHVRVGCPVVLVLVTPLLGEVVVVEAGAVGGVGAVAVVALHAPALLTLLAWRTRVQRPHLTLTIRDVNEISRILSEYFKK